MKSRRTPSFRKDFRALPQDVQRQAQSAFQKFKHDPFYPSLQFKKVGDPNLYSARINDDFRTLGFWDGDTISWIWIGPHAEYDKILK